MLFTILSWILYLYLGAVFVAWLVPFLYLSLESRNPFTAAWHSLELALYAAWLPVKYLVLKPITFLFEILAGAVNTCTKLCKLFTGESRPVM